jgi:dynein intermediate chain 2, axonemal
MERFYMPRYKSMIGRPCRFANRDNLLVAIPTDPKLGEQFIFRRLADQSIQAVVEKSVSTANTVNKVYVGKGVTHIEGGWPKDLNRSDEEQTQRYRKKIEKSDGFSSQVNNLAKVLSF